MSRAVLITGATGNQGGSVIDALVAKQPSDFLLLAVTRNAQSASAKRLAAKSASIKLSAKQVAETSPLWGVYSVQASMGKGVILDGEIRQGKALVDESIKAKVQHFVYSSVERGGDERSWDNATPTILQPVIFMDNLIPGFTSKIFLTTLRDIIREKLLHRAVGLAGDELTFRQLSQEFQKVTGEPAGTTFGMLGKALKYSVSEVGIMVDWFKDDGYAANLPEIRRIHPNVTTMEQYLKKSAFAK
ncbi:hypothetical protein EDB80DRAFT_843031 [Ilyonectria destructans]|nr:hypothetical protein EDB80DRAFT_843031 [Ilyonectria destructans]